MHRLRFVPLAVSALLAACPAETGAPAPGDSGDPGDTDTGEACTPESPHFTLAIALAEGAVVGAEDVVWYGDGGSSGYCADQGDGTWRCDAPAGAAEYRVSVSGHLRVEGTVDVPAEGCDMPEIDVALENLGAWFPEDRAYVIRLIEDDYECEHSWELYGANCHMTAVFCADGDAEVMLTDIVYPGIYGVDGAAIDGLFDAGGEIPDDLDFTATSETTIEDSAYAWTWTRSEDPIFTASTCR